MSDTTRVSVTDSNNQTEEETTDGCGRPCPMKCHLLQGAKLPLYTFKKGKYSGDLNCAQQHQTFFLDTILLGEWEDRASRGLFRYDVTACKTKVISGMYGFIAQLNEGRHLKKRHTEFRVDKVLQPFDESKFNFTKICLEEIMFRFEESKDGRTSFYQDAPLRSTDSPSIVAINVSPIEYGHVLLIPHILECLPQRIDHEGFFLALCLASEAANPCFRVGYNSLGAFGTINHLHFQAYYLAAPLPVEKALAFLVNIPKLKCGVRIYELSNYPVRGLVFEGGCSLRALSDVVSNACIFLQENNIPYNVLIADSGKRIFLFPQCYAEKQALGYVEPELLDTQVNPAVWEISGHVVLKRKQDYEDASEENAWNLLAVVSLSPETFCKVKACILEVEATCREPIHEGDEAEACRSHDLYHPVTVSGKDKCSFIIDE